VIDFSNDRSGRPALAGRSAWASGAVAYLDGPGDRWHGRGQSPGSLSVFACGGTMADLERGPPPAGGGSAPHHPTSPGGLRASSQGGQPGAAWPAAYAAVGRGMALGPAAGLPMAAVCQGPRQRGGGLLGPGERAGALLEGSSRWVSKAGAAPQRTWPSLWAAAAAPGSLPIGERGGGDRKDALTRPANRGMRRVGPDPWFKGEARPSSATTRTRLGVLMMPSRMDQKHGQVCCLVRAALCTDS